MHRFLHRLGGCIQIIISIQKGRGWFAILFLFALKLYIEPSAPKETEGYVFRDIENVTINHSLPTSKSDMSESVNSDVYTITQLCRFVKELNREDRGLKHTPNSKTATGNP